MFSRSALLVAAAALASTVVADIDQCPADAPLSCSSGSSGADTCCTEVQGLVVQTQFWDAGSQTTGPTDSWTIHGLWPDNCDGSFQSTCDSSRQYTDIAGILSNAGQQSTLDYMNTYWKDISGDDESFWEHEWGKHGTCYSTLNPSCFSGYQQYEEAVDFFVETVNIFQQLPTYQWLSAAGITPSSSKKYTKSAVNAALSAQHGADVVLNCKSGNLNEIYYAFNVRGSVANGDYYPTQPVGSSGSCPSSFYYQPKQGGSKRDVAFTA